MNVLKEEINRSLNEVRQLINSYPIDLNKIDWILDSINKLLEKASAEGNENIIRIYDDFDYTLDHDFKGLLDVYKGRLSGKKEIELRGELRSVLSIIVATLGELID